MSEPTIEEMRDVVLAVYPNAYRCSENQSWSIWESERHQRAWMNKEMGFGAIEAEGFLGDDWIHAYSKLPAKYAIALSCALYEFRKSYAPLAPSARVVESFTQGWNARARHDAQLKEAK